ncbi:MAG: hypothetical protein EBS05_25080 [Proteobacteria bacterium]|nr:hypothetical protein [Pseudomonadota bacterium]
MRPCVESASGLNAKAQIRQDAKSGGDRARVVDGRITGGTSDHVAESFKVTPSHPARQLHDLQKQAHAQGFQLVSNA